MIGTYKPFQTKNELTQSAQGTYIRAVGPYSILPIIQKEIQIVIRKLNISIWVPSILVKSPKDHLLRRGLDYLALLTIDSLKVS